MTELTQPLPQTRHSYAGLIGIVAIIAASVVGWFLFPDNLALLTRIIAIALLVLSLDLVTGYCGIATLGHAAHFGAGAYGAGIAAAHFGVTDPILMTVIGLLAGAVTGLVSGAVILRATGLAQLVLSIAVVHLFHEAANKASGWTGGSDGLSGISPDPIFGIFEFDLYGRTVYIYAVILLLISFIFLRYVVRSPFGMLCRGVKEDPIRIHAMGASVQGAQLRMYVISGAVAGISGLSTQSPHRSSASTVSASPCRRKPLSCWCWGGAGSLFGGLVGTVVFMWFEDVVSTANPFHWLTMVGALLIAVVLFAPRGLYGTLAYYFEKKARRK
ncbi:branched-chain amino acid ABC transporter permease [Brucella melitensis]|uniref:branched-chain amino acid ABC transporter permease n=1 Tax=Brucella melitensis TaxID=29459 RepID=UPI0001B5908F|nr:branched-chain amino acid ABC transporter permease [Brucella melitensis]AVM32373.1 branched-chain amino acid ABC transporter permease [Brucella melitensis]EEZ13313.1 inner-membrane translocator [Brucella melitensis bv. 1 str. Rev.1]